MKEINIKTIIYFIIALSFLNIAVLSQNKTAVDSLSITEQLAYSTVRLIVNNNRIGTAFFYRYDFDIGSIVVLVTNKHVILGSKIGTFLLTQANTDGTPNNKLHIHVNLDNFENRWIYHPDKNVDIAIMPILPLLEAASKKNEPVFFRAMDKKLIPSNKQRSLLNAVENVLVVGYPEGFWDPINNYPIFRSGITAVHPLLDYYGNKDMLIDAAIFPGSSGSPVFIYNSGSYYDKTKGPVIIGERCYFVGIIYALYEYSPEGKLKIINVPSKKDTTFIPSITTNLGIAVKAERLNDFEPILKKMIQVEK